MGRVEKILVVAIFGVVVMILGVTAFLPDSAREQPRNQPGGSSGADPAAGQPASKPADTSGMTPIQRLLRAGLDAPAVGGAEPAEKEKKVAPNPAADQHGVAQVPGPTAPSSIGGGRKGLTVPNDPRYVKVKVAAGETLGEIVRRECGSLRYLDDARRLNEHLDADMVFTGQEILLPYISPEKLPAPSLAGAERDRAADGTLPLVNRTSPGPLRDSSRDEVRPAEASAAAPSSHKVRKGETLWAIAETKWGRAQAAKKVTEILALNSDKLPSERALKEGQVIKLPK